MSFTLVNDTSGNNVIVDNRILIRNDKTKDLLYCSYTQDEEKYQVDIETAVLATNVQVVDVDNSEECSTVACTPNDVTVRPLETSSMPIDNDTASQLTPSTFVGKIEKKIMKPFHTNQVVQQHKRKISFSLGTSIPKRKRSDLLAKLLQSISPPKVLFKPETKVSIIDGATFSPVSMEIAPNTITENTTAIKSNITNCSDDSSNSDIEIINVRDIHESEGQEECHIEWEDQDDFERRKRGHLIHKDSTQMQSNNFEEEGKQSMCWSREDTLKLIAQYKEMLPSFKSPTIKKTRIWRRIALKLPPYTVTQCINRFKYLRRKYFEKKDNTKERKLPFAYFDQMDDIFHTAPIVKPVSVYYSHAGVKNKQTHKSNFTHSANSSGYKSIGTANRLSEEIYDNVKTLSALTNKPFTSRTEPMAENRTTSTSSAMPTGSSNVLLEQQKIQYFKDKSTWLRQVVASMDKLTAAIDRLVDHTISKY